MEYFNKTNIVILDENDLFREGMKRILESSEKFEVIGAISTFKALQDVLSQHPDILLIDAVVFHKHYKYWVHQIIENYSSTILVILPEKETAYDVSQAFQLGVKGFFTKDMQVDLLLEALESVQA